MSGQPLLETLYLDDYFEGVYETDLQRFQATAELEDMLRAEGLDGVSSLIVWDIDASTRGEDVWNDYFLRKDSSSQTLCASACGWFTVSRRAIMSMPRRKSFTWSGWQAGSGIFLADIASCLLPLASCLPRHWHAPCDWIGSKTMRKKEERAGC